MTRPFPDADQVQRSLQTARSILVQSIASKRPFGADGVIRQLAASSRLPGHGDISFIAGKALERLDTTGSWEAVVPYLCQLAVEIDRALVARPEDAERNQRASPLTSVARIRVHGE